MSLVLSQEQTMLRDAAAGYLADHAPVAQLRRLRDDDVADGFDRATWAAMAEMGWAGVLIPEDHGGVGLGMLEAGLIAEEMGRTLTASPFLSTAVLGATALVRHGSAAQRAEWLPRIAAGTALTALAVDESRRHVPETVATRARRHGNGFRLNGAKTFVIDAHVADALLVSARTAAGITLFLVPAGTPGVTVDRTRMVDERNAGRVTLSDVDLTADAVLGDVDGGAAVLRTVLNAGRAALAAEMSGAAQEATARSIAYIKDRTQFGARVGSFQALQHRAAHLYTETELGRSIVMKALMALDADAPDAELLVSAAKAKLGQVAQLAAREAVQFHGGVGMTDAVDIGFFMKRIRAAEAHLGDANFHADRFARLRGY
ncbi:MAG: alkylation response protein AidB-like acyl-CoA dehydrogenase [Paracoccaceae bacterium]|jgi:alkylation response protein AidB-like acyl-CoA dehydrogenase